MAAHQTKVALTPFRRKVMEDQNRLNYQNEYDRIRVILSQNLNGLHRESIEGLRRRQDRLQELGARAVDHIQE